MNRRCGRDKTADCSLTWPMRGLRRVKDRSLHRNWRERCAANNADDSTDAAPAIVRLSNWTRARMIRGRDATCLVGCSEVAGCSPAISVDTARIVRGCCAVGGLTFDKGMVSERFLRVAFGVARRTGAFRP